jgi:hypothetical protein
MPSNFTGVEVGFFSIIGAAAGAGAEYAERLVDYRERRRDDEARL